MKIHQNSNTSFGSKLICRAMSDNAPEQDENLLFNRGFTLVELIVVVAILGILATMAIPSYNDMAYRAKISGAKADIRTLEDSIGAYFIDQDKLPTLLSDIGIQGNRKDPWNHTYQYYNIGKGTGDGARYTSWDINPVTLDNCLNHDYDLYSRGPDGLTANAIPDPTGAKNASSDDIVRVAEGGSIELASDY